jgi:signal transduction histidine kinase
VGAVCGAVGFVPADAQLAVYRIVQEALTNTIRHSRGATRAQVRLEYTDPVIEIDITDDRQPGTSAGHHEPAGHGLAGMRERAAFYGGALIAGPRPGGGWRVSAGLSPAAQVLARPAP